MAYKTDATIAVVESILKKRCRALINAIDKAYQDYQELTDAQDGQSTLAWARDLTEEFGCMTYICD